MTTKLTLSIDKEIIAKAKSYAKDSGRSLSDLVESYFQEITSKQLVQEDQELNSIYGILDLPNDFDEKEEIRNILSSKHFQQ